MNKQSIDSQMLRALELFHYSYQFRDSLFLIVLASGTDFESVTSDLRVIQSSHINIAIVCEHNDEIVDRVARWNARGASYRYWSAQGRLPDSLVNSAQQSLECNTVPIVGISPGAGECSKFPIMPDSIELAERLGARKLFYLSSYAGLVVDGKCQSHPLPEEVELMLTDNRDTNIGNNMLSYIYEQQQRSGLEIILLDGKRGSLFQEIFTHRGKGTLFSNQYPNIIRQATLADIEDISILMRPYITDGSVLSLSDEEIESTISDYSVYTINGAIVAVAKLKSYGQWAELGKFCTLPRYQGRGRARELARHLIAEAQRRDKTHVFALSTWPRMWVFFSQLGFKSIDRNLLPLNWKDNYDFSRSSRAMYMPL